MLPKIVTPSEFRRDLARYLHRAETELIVVKDRTSNRVIMDEKEFNRLSALANQFMEEDPEGTYRPAFVKEILKRAKDSDIDSSVKSLKDLL